VTSITVLRERTTGTLERLLTMPLAKLERPGPEERPYPVEAPPASRGASLAAGEAILSGS
jgi:hypothetical protein